MSQRLDVRTGAELIAKVMRDGQLLTTGEVAELFGVDPKTPARWDREGKLPAMQVARGGHRRWRSETVRPLLQLERAPA